MRHYADILYFIEATWLKTPSWELDCLGSHPGFITYYGTLGKLFNFSVPQFFPPQRPFIFILKNFKPAEKLQEQYQESLYILAQRPHSHSLIWSVASFI